MMEIYYLERQASTDFFDVNRHFGVLFNDSWHQWASIYDVK